MKKKVTQKEIAELSKTEAGDDNFDTADYQGANLNCEAPNKDLGSFSGKVLHPHALKISQVLGLFMRAALHLHIFTAHAQLLDAGKPIDIGDDAGLLLRGASLKNTRFVYGVVCYCGDDTKVALNSLGTGKMKRSQLERQVSIITAAAMFVCVRQHSAELSFAHGGGGGAGRRVPRTDLARPGHRLWGLDNHFDRVGR